jgi:hypothetical protein
MSHAPAEQVVISPWWFAAKDWEHAQGLPENALRTLARNEKSVFSRMFSGEVSPSAAAPHLIGEMQSHGMEVGSLSGRVQELGVQLSDLLKTARVNGGGELRTALRTAAPRTLATKRPKPETRKL